MSNVPQGAAALSPQELRALQMVLLEMLTEVDRVCKKNGISYAIIGGTLLGAVRHGGFIPWDDDLDVAMLRAEYVRFRAACAADLDASRFFFQDDTTDAHYRLGYGRIRRKDSEFVRIGQEHIPMQTGIFLDIFPVDFVSDFYPLRALQSAYCYVLRKLLYARSGKKAAKSAVLRAWYAALDRVPARFTFRRLAALAGRLGRHPSDWVRALTFPTPKGGKAGYRLKWYTDLADMAFEGKMFPAPREYDGYLRYKYGDYLALPPPEKRHWHPAAKFRLPAEFAPEHAPDGEDI